MSGITRACQGHTRKSKHSFRDIQVGAESNLNSPKPRVRDIRQLLLRASVLSPVVRLRVSASAQRASFACRVGGARYQGMSLVLVDQVVGVVCMCAELAGTRGSKRPGVFLGVFNCQYRRD